MFFPAEPGRIDFRLRPKTIMTFWKAD